jgi:mRNA-degrading endonuclease RelE of RelBE toxin-antitoxin system
MSKSWIITSKPSFHTEWLLVSEQDSQAVLDKIAFLAQDPRPDGYFKKQLPYLQGKLHGIRARNYHIFYTFERPHVNLLALRLREQNMDKTAFDDLSLKVFFDADGETTPTQEIDWHDILTRRTRLSQPLPEQISVSLLKKLHVPSEYHARLLSTRTQEELLNCPGIPSYFLQMIEEALWKKPIAEIAQQPDHIIAEVSDLQRYAEGDLHGFLLRLAPEQERAARRALDAGGPTQVKGRPGTGKSTVALYRVQYLLERLSNGEEPKPRILFTTYTNALVEASRSLLKQLLGTNIDSVQIRTADSLLSEFLKECSRPNIAEGCCSCR